MHSIARSDWLGIATSGKTTKRHSSTSYAACVRFHTSKFVMEEAMTKSVYNTKLNNERRNIVLLHELFKTDGLNFGTTARSLSLRQVILTIEIKLYIGGDTQRERCGGCG